MQMLDNRYLIEAIKLKSFEVSFEDGDQNCILSEDALNLLVSIRDQYEERLQTVVNSVRTNFFQIESDYYEGGVVFDVETGKCIEAAPIIAWMVGRSFEDIKTYVKNKGLKMRKV